MNPQVFKQPNKLDPALVLQAYDNVSDGSDVLQVIRADGSVIGGLRDIIGGVVDPTAAPYYAKGDGVTDDTAALKAAWADYVAQPFGRFYLPRGKTFKLAAGVIAMFNAQGKDGIIVDGHGATLLDVFDYQAGPSQGILFDIRGAKGVRIEVGKIVSSVPTSTHTGDRGLKAMRCYHHNGVGCSDVVFRAYIEGCLSGFEASKLSTDPDACRSRNITVVIDTYNVFYPLSCQFSGDNIEAMMWQELTGRPYFVYGIDNHRIRYRVKEQKKSTIIGGGSAGGLDAPLCGCSNIDLHVISKEGDGSPWGAIGADLIQIAYRWDAAAPGPVTHKNIRIHFDAKKNWNAGGGYGNWDHGLTFQKLLVGGAVDTTGRGHVLDNFRASGVIEAHASSASAPVDNYQSSFAGGDTFNNVVMDELRTANVDPNYPPGVIVRASGDGTPEGNLVGRVGSEYNRRDGGAGTCKYIKESGTGKTGWVAK